MAGLTLIDMDEDKSVRSRVYGACLVMRDWSGVQIAVLTIETDTDRLAMEAVCRDFQSNPQKAVATKVAKVAGEIRQMHPEEAITGGYEVRLL